MNTLNILLICVSAVLLATCKPTSDPNPPTSGGEPAAATLADCTDSYGVDARITDGSRGLDLEQLVNGKVITDRAPFECALPDGDSRSSFDFDTAVSNAGCSYAMSYVNDSTGEAFSGSVVLDCSTSELDYTATATPDASSPKCAGASRLVDDPKIKLNTDNCGNDVD